MLNFNDEPSFRPCYTPIEMFTLGVFGGAYFKLKTQLPAQFTAAASGLLTAEPEPNCNNNCYRIIGGAPLEWWTAQGLIHADDPNGWVEWYVKFYYGRRHQDDARQIQRFRAFVTRHLGMLRGLEAKGRDSAKTKQNLLQWAWNHEINP